MPRRGDVWWAEHLEVGRRPVLVLTRSEAIPVLRHLSVAPATRTVRRIPTEVLVGPDEGMPSECAFSFDNVTLLPRGYLVNLICQMGPHTMRDACRAMAAAFDC